MFFFFAKKAIEKGADGLVAVAAGAGGHAGTLSPFALIQEIREWFNDSQWVIYGDGDNGFTITSSSFNVPSTFTLDLTGNKAYMNYSSFQWYKTQSSLKLAELDRRPCGNLNNDLRQLRNILHLQPRLIHHR